MTNQSDTNTKSEVNALVGTTTIDPTAFATTQGIVANPTTGVAALNTAVGLRALQTDLTATNIIVTTNRTALDARATDNLANVDATLNSPSPDYVTGFPIDIPAFTKSLGNSTTGTTYPITNTAGVLTNYATQLTLTNSGGTGNDLYTFGIPTTTATWGNKLYSKYGSS